MNGSYKSPSERAAGAGFAPGLSEEARKSMNAAFDALSDWRNELTAVTERNTSKVFDRMSAAAKAVGWPAQFVDQTRSQMQAASKMQLQMIDQVMDVWEQQMKAPGSSYTLPAIPSMPFPGAGQNPFVSAGVDFSQMQMAPFQFWMQAAEMWQKGWMQAVSTWMDAQAGTSSRNPAQSRFPFTH